MSILRELFVKLGMDVDAQSFAKGQLAAEGVKLVLEKTVDAARELASTFIENIKVTAEYGEHIKQMSATTGIGTDTLQRFGLAAASEGIGLGQMGHSLVLLARSMSSAKAGSEETAAAFHKANVQITDQAGKLRPMQDVFLDLSDRFSTMEAGADKTALALKLFGRSGFEMIELLNKGRGELEEFMEASVMTEEQIQAGKQVVEVQRALTAQTEQLWRSAIGPLLPAVRDLLKQFLAWKKENAELMKQNIARFLGLAIVVVKDLGKAFAGVVATMKFFSENWKPVLALILGGLAGWAIANAGLVASFLAVQAAAVGAAIASAAAWLVAAAPFLALGAVVAGILLLFDDLRVYSESVAKGGTGKNTLFGQFSMMIDRMAAGKGEKPWWLTALIEAKVFLLDILDIMRQLGWAKKPGNEGPSSKMKVDPERSAKLEQYKAAHPEQQLIERHGIARLFRGQYLSPEEAALVPYGQGAHGPSSVPSLPPATGGQSLMSGGTTVGSLSFSITGNDPKAIRKEVADHLESVGIVTARDVESAAADASYSQ